jgi:hypothetical protein
MQTSGERRREIANAYSVVITRLVRNCATRRVIQHSVLKANFGDY